MAIPEVETPDFYRLIRRTRCQQRPVVRDVHGHDRQLVAVQGEEELQGVVVEYLYRAVQESHWGTRAKHAIHRSRITS